MTAKGRGQNEKIMPYLDFLTKKPMFRYTSCFKSEIQSLASDQRPDIKKWPPRGQNEKVLPYLNFLTQKTYV